LTTSATKCSEAAVALGSEEDTDSESLYCSIKAYKLYTRVWTSTFINLIKDSRVSDALNKASELYASKCELNVLLLVAAEPPVV
jgi:hypothetical protein